MQTDVDTSALRILILSTPKTGNTWLARLLSSVYELPQLGLVMPFDVEQARRMGKRWVVFHHVRPTPELLDWMEEANPVVLTAIRHPADVLVSLYYHLREFQSGPIDAAAAQGMLAGPFERYDVLSDASGSFRDDLECSLSWLRSGKTNIVRYEDLWRDVHAELTRLTSLICPVPPERIDLAIERSDISLMRRLAGDYGRFFRSGKVGGWAQALPPEIVEELRQEPYRSLVDELGYSMDPADPFMTAPRVLRPSINPFKRSGGLVDENEEEEARFENGVPVVALLVDIYLALCQKQDWKGTPAAIGEGSFYEWLNQPCDVRARDGYGAILITNLAFQLHRMRPDLNQTFIDLQAPARADYADWFVRFAEQSVDLDAAFTEPVRRSLIEWANTRSSEDRESWPWWPKLPNFAIHLHRQSAELKAVFPDILCFDRWSFLQWIVQNHQEANVNPEFIVPVARSLKKLAKLRSVGRYLPGARVRVARAAD